MSAGVGDVWRSWVAENLLRREPADEVIAALVDEGLPREDAAALVRETLASPIFRAAVPFARESRRLRTFARMDHQRRQPFATSLERVPFPGVEAFYRRYWSCGLPVIFTGMTDGWPAHERWQLPRLRERFGALEVDITEGRESNPNYDREREKHMRTVRMDAYIDRILATESSNDFYMIAQNRNSQRALTSIFDDVIFPKGLFVDAPAVGSAFWLGPRGTVTPLHHDTSNILFFQLIGRKRVRMVAPLEIALLDGASAMYAGVNPEAPDLDRFPWWPQVPVIDVVLEPGDALFIPVGMWHHVRALDISVSLAMNAFVEPNRYDYMPAAD